MRLSLSEHQGVGRYSERGVPRGLRLQLACWRERLKIGLDSRHGLGIQHFYHRFVGFFFGENLQRHRRTARRNRVIRIRVESLEAWRPHFEFLRVVIEFDGTRPVNRFDLLRSAEKLHAVEIGA